jgi:hypothetical protein
LPPVSSRDPELSDRDNWFAEPGGPGTPPGVEHRRRADADRLAGEPAAGPAGRLPAFRDVSPRMALGLAAALVVVVLAGLAAAGVFSGGGTHQPTSATTPPTPTTTPQTTTTTTRHRGTTTTPARSGGRVVPTSTLKPGDTGAQVKLLQRALTRLGYSPGAADGDYGPSTEAAVKRFQDASKLTADGIVGPATLKALAKAVHRSR